MKSGPAPSLAFASRFLISVIPIAMVGACFGGSPLMAQLPARGAAAAGSRQLAPVRKPLQAALQPLRSLSMASADFNGDGVTDLAIGSSNIAGGGIAIELGNLDAIAPQSEASWTAAGLHHATPPFLPASQTIQLDSTPDILLTADGIGSGHQDLVYATTGSGAIYLLHGNGDGTFSDAPISLLLPGGVTAIAAYRPGAPFAGEALVVGYQTAQSSQVAILAFDGSGFSVHAAYPMPGTVTAMAVGNLSNTSIPDVAIVAGGQLMVLHGAGAITGNGQLDTLPVSNAEAVTTGEFLFDRHANIQISVIDTNGNVLILAHSGLDSTPFTAKEIVAQRGLRPGSPTLAQLAGNNSNEPWTVVETNSGLAVHSVGGPVPLLLRSQAGAGGDNLVVVNPDRQESVTLTHASSANSPSPVVRTSVRSLASENVVAALSARVNTDVRQGVVTLAQNETTPEFTVPSAGNTFYVNTTADNTGTTVDTDDGSRCSSGGAETCTLRDAVTFADVDAAANISGAKSDTIMVPAGTYPLTWQHGTLDSNGSAVTHLEILGPVSIVGTASSGVPTTIINASSNDVAFAINPGPYGSLTVLTSLPGKTFSASSVVLNAALTNITIENGKNPDNPNTSGNSNYVGGAINWDAFGTGNLTLTNVNVENSTSLYNDGGGLWVTNSTGGGTGMLTISGGTISGNSSPDTGGGINDANPPVAMAISNATISGNTANISVSPSSTFNAGAGGGILMDGPASASTPLTTFTNVTISSNTALNEGGGIYTLGNFQLTGSVVTGNSVTGSNSYGGGIWMNLTSPDQATITSTDILANTTGSGGIGGGIYIGSESDNQLSMSLSRIYGNTATGTAGLAVEGAATATAKDNWWGCNAGPSNASCDAADSGATTNPWAVLSLSASTTLIDLGQNIGLTVGLNTDSNGAGIAGAFPAVATNYNYNWAVSGVSAALNGTTGAFNTSGAGTATLTPTSATTSINGAAVSLTFDGQTVSDAFTVEAIKNFTVAAPSSTPAGTAFNVTVTAIQSTGGTFTPYTGTVHFTTTASSANLPADYTFVPSDNGVHIFSVTLNTGGNQTVTVTDIVTSSATGTSGTISVDTPPVVTTNPTNVTVAAGSSATFTAAASGFPTPTVQWQVSTNGGSTFSNIAGATSTTLSFVTSVSQNGNQYQAVFTNTLTTAMTTTATLTVTASPVVTTNPTNVTLNAGSTASFTAAATGTPTPTVQWQVSTDGTTYSNISGATTTTLTLLSVSVSQNGNFYRAVFTNSTGTAMSTAAKLTVDYAPTVTTNPTSQSIAAGSNVSFTAAASGNPAPTVQWQISTNGGSTFSNITGATSTTLSLTSVPTTDNGYQYHAVFTNSLNTATTTPATLTVSGASLSIAATHASPIFQAGPGILTLTVTNSGTATVSTATVSDTLNSSFTINSASTGCAVSSQTVTCTIVPGLTGSTAFKVYVTTSATASTAGISNTATLADSVDTITAGGSSTDTITVTARAPLADSKLTQLSLSGSTDSPPCSNVSPHNTLTASVPLQNIGGSTLTNPYATNITLTGGNTLMSDSASATSVAANGTVTYTFHILLASCNSFVLSFDVDSN